MDLDLYEYEWLMGVLDSLRRLFNLFQLQARLLQLDQYLLRPGLRSIPI
jgi:hypothetical protein